MRAFDVLFVDDEPNVLSGIRRQLRRTFAIDTANGPEEGLRKLRENTYPVIVTDMRMPGMNGAEFLCAARKIQPHAIRMVLSGEASIDSAIDAVNNGSIYRYLRKPTDPQTLATGVNAALERFRAAENERDLLEKTLGGAVETLAEALQLAHPAAFRTTSRVVRITTELGATMGIEPAWELRIAASLVFIGCIALSEKTLLDAVMVASPSEEFTRHTRIGQELIGRIPRLENAAAIVGGHLEKPTRAEIEGFDQLDGVRRGAIVLGLAVEADRLVTIGHTKGQVLEKMAPSIDAKLRKALSLSKITPDGELDLRSLRIQDLEVGMIAVEPIETLKGLKLMSKDAEITRAMRERILNFHRSVGIREPVRVAVPRP